MLFSDARKNSDGANIAFIIDSSESIGIISFMDSKSFVKEVMIKLAGNSRHLEIAVMLYSTTVSVKLDFSQKYNLMDFIVTIDHLRWESGYARTDIALKMSSEYIFTNDTLSRRLNVPMIAILMTDGKTTKNVQDFVPLSNASEPLKQKGVRIFVVGITSGADEQELLEITERESDLILAYDSIITYGFYTLRDTVDNVVNKVLSAIGKNLDPLDTNIIDFDRYTTRI